MTRLFAPRRSVEPLRLGESSNVTDARMRELFASAVEVQELSDARVEQLWQKLSEPGALPIVALEAADSLDFDVASVKVVAWPTQRWVAGLLLAAVFLGGTVFAANGFFRGTPAKDPAAQTLSSVQTPDPKISTPAAAPVETSAEPSNNPEATLLLGALERLRRAGDAQGALALLNSHQERFPGGVLKREVTVAKVEALIALERRQEALALLQNANLSAFPKGAELRVLRGELSGTLGQCTQALADFEHTLKSNAGEALLSRALFGQASCKSRLGQHQEAQRDFREYLKRFPKGHLADAAKRALAGR